MTQTRTAPVVVVGIDGSAGADAALRWTQQYADATGASVQVVVAWDWPVAYGYPMSFEGLDPKGDALRVAEKAAGELNLPPERIEIRTPEGMAGDALVKASADADLLVVGRHGHRVVSSLLLGSVSTHCVHHAMVPVVVVH